MRRARWAAVALVVVVVSAGACGAKEEPKAATGGGGGGSSATGGAAVTTGGSGTTAAGRCAPTSIRVTTDKGSATIDDTTNYADIIGETPPQSGTFTLANYAIAESEARGVLQPAGLEAGNAVVVMTVSAPEIAPGTYVDQSEKNVGADKVVFFSIYTADGRALPTPHHEVTITEVGTDKVCGSVRPAAGGGTGATATGTFTAKRIDSSASTKGTSKASSGSTGSTGTTRSGGPKG